MSYELAQIVTWVAQCMPNADQVKWIQLHSSEVRFQWRGRVFRVSTDHLFVEEVEKDSLLVGSDEAALIQQLLRKQSLLEGGAQ